MKKSVEIALATYNRPEFVREWFELHKSGIEKYGFVVSVYDSSTNEETKQIIEKEKSQIKFDIRYFRVDSKIRVDEKVLMLILNSKCDYVWPLGDSNYYDLDDLNQKVIPYLEQNYDVACIFSSTELDNDNKTYTDAVEFVGDCFWHATWLGGMLIKKTLFGFQYKDSTFNKYMEKYNRNDGFSYLGVLYDILAQKLYVQISFNVVQTKSIGKNKVPGWLKRYFEVWCDNLCYFVDTLDSRYDPVKDKVIRTTWEVLKLDGLEWCCKARLANGLNEEIFNRYNTSGLIDQVSSHKQRIRFYATTNIHVVSCIYNTYRSFRKIKHFLKKLLKGD